MQLLSKQFPDSFNIYLISDAHEGSSLQHKEGLKEVIETVASDKIGYMASGGDDIEAIMVDDKRYDAETIDTETKAVPLLQAEAVIDIYQPVKKKLLFKLTGNHEYKLHRFGNLTQFICKRLEVPYGTYSCKFTALDKKNKPMFKFFYTHGWGSVGSTADDPVRRLANMQLQIKRKLQPLAGDCVLMACGHNHKLIVVEPERELYLTDNGTHIKAKYTKPPQFGDYIDPSLRWYCSTGSFLKLYGDMGVSGYAERMMLSPSELGYIKVEVRDKQITSVQKVVI